MQITFIALVDDQPGVLNQVASLVRRRNYNIESLTVGHTHQPGTSRMTLVIDAEPAAAPRIEANLRKIFHVQRVENLSAAPAVYRELALLKISATLEQRSQIVQLADVFRARVLDVAAESLIIEATGTEDKIDSLLDALRPFGVTEMARTGCLAMTRGSGLGPTTETTTVVADADENIAYSV